MVSLESRRRGDSNEYTQTFTIITLKKKITLNDPKYIMSASKGLFPRELRTSSEQPW